MTVIVITPEDPEYEQLRFNWDTRFNVFPKKIIQPLNSRGVADTLKYIQKREYKFSIRGGKHCFEPWSLTYGILFDMSKINHIILKHDVATIGSGGVLGDIYNVLLDNNRMIPAGTRPTVGIGGQGQNGGIGYSTKMYGLLTDCIIGYKILLADRSIVTCSEDENSDLYWALRGSGAGNFGIVIEYYVQTYEAPSVTVFTYEYSLDIDGRDALKWVIFPSKCTKKLTSQALITKDSIKITGQYFGTPSGLIGYLDDLPEPVRAEIKYISFREAIQYFSAPTKKESAKAKSRFGDRPLSDIVIDRLIASVENISMDPNARYTIGIQQLKGSSNGSMPWKNCTYWINWALRWTEGPEPEANELERSYRKTIQHMTNWSYMGMMDSEVGNFPEAYYGDEEHQEKLLKIKAKYDPDNFFRYPQGLVR